MATFSMQRVAERLRKLLADPKRQLDELQNQPSHGLKGSTIAVGQTPGDLVGDAPITVSLAQIDALRNQIKQAQQEAADLRVALEAAKRGDPNGDTAKLERLSRAMLEIVRFAVANLPPSDIPKWPRDSVQFVVNNLAVLPEYSVDDETLVAELQLFVREIEEHELRRGNIRHRTVLPIRDRRGASRTNNWRSQEAIEAGGVVDANGRPDFTAWFLTIAHEDHAEADSALNQASLEVDDRAGGKERIHAMARRVSEILMASNDGVDPSQR